VGKLGEKHGIGSDIADEVEHSRKTNVVVKHPVVVLQNGIEDFLGATAG
jgi:hypothetical protein